MVRQPLSERQFEALELLVRSGVVDERPLLKGETFVLQRVVKIGDERTGIIGRPELRIRAGIGIGNRNVVKAGRPQVVRDLIDVEGVRIDAGDSNRKGLPQLPLESQRE